MHSKGLMLSVLAFWSMILPAGAQSNSGISDAQRLAALQQRLDTYKQEIDQLKDKISQMSQAKNTVRRRHPRLGFARHNALLHWVPDRSCARLQKVSNIAVGTSDLTCNSSIFCWN